MILKNPTTPCIKICEMDKETQLCKGCFRTISEIAVWGMLNENQKDLIYNEIGKRKLKMSQK
ncbi:MAG: DUF1289 domain-containing protein [Melioribacteraceae bacterium]|nr:DUF1289 domain-containing protein [Ignavibacteriota bacterium]MBZ0183105.1 DUF1289 domain-containing protein [Melioribacteraceae bacterium]|tara:strand:- start:41 stop:226 length:186 start_codon:yes stop_codon:yes gene_type:complete